MINFKKLDENKEKFRLNYLTAKPFSHLLIENICDDEKLHEAYNSIPDISNKSKDLVFAKNKFEKSNYGEIHPFLKELYDDLKSEKFNQFISFISGGKEVFVDPKNYGGGLHQGRGNSKLDMHLDFNYHPENKLWYREMNILLYMNKDWKSEHKGHLDIEDLRTGETKSIPVNWNSMIIQQCAPFSLHGYALTNFPEDKYRTSVATYAYQKHIRNIEDPRTTDWFVDDDESAFKKFLGRNIKSIIKVKHFFFGSATSKN